MAGPVTVCALAIPESAFKGSTLRLGSQGRTLGPGPFDSKKLSPAKRELIVQALKLQARQGRLVYKISSVSAVIIDRKGIVFAVNLAIKRSLSRLAPRLPLGTLGSKCEVLLDGGLRAPKEYKKQKTIIRGDSMVPIIGLASVLAKVHRDKKMTRLAIKFPNWNLEVHKGYGTRAHYAALRKHGPSAIHRLSFIQDLLG